jgi:hypothetical protein
LKAALNLVKRSLPDAEINAVIDEVDADGNGSIEYVIV